MNDVPFLGLGWALRFVAAAAWVDGSEMAKSFPSPDLFPLVGSVHLVNSTVKPMANPVRRENGDLG